MTKPRKPRRQPASRDPFAAWGNVPVDSRAERRRLAAIVARNGRGIISYRDFCRDLSEACHDANSELYERARKDPPAVAAALKELADTLAAARVQLMDLGADATSALAARAVAASPGGAVNDGASLWKYLEPPGTRSGQVRLEWLDRTLAECAGWASDASDTIEKPANGRPPDKIAARLVERLAEIWQMQTGKKATLVTDVMTTRKTGDFLTFCEEIAGPIWGARDFSTPSIKDFVQAHLYPKRRGRTRR